ncbi:putative germin-like protein 2-2 [Malania oleifera]|uniref:putative germin-like protein 2-2 n=1 Tax=Malania oleifera TaxID=397392 RepID=UPI0025AEA18F|nr:putative germin-like protein 2-2 [Malania oleifera]
MAVRVFLLGLFLVISSSSTLASEFPSRYKTICVKPDINSTVVLVNGFPCKNISEVQANDFFSSGLNPPKTFNRYGSSLAWATVTEIPGLNTLGVSMVLAIFEAGGIFPPHTNQADELVFVLEGTIEVGIITPYPDNRLISKVLNQGELFGIPTGPVHYQINQGTTNAAILVALSSQDVAPVMLAETMFGSNLKLETDLLAKAFHVDKRIITQIVSKF